MNKYIYVPGEPDEVVWKDEIPKDMPKLNAEARQEYSKVLQALATRCVVYDPADRPELEDILEQILEHTTVGGSSGTDLARGMRAHPGDQSAPEQYRMRFPPALNGYQIGFTVEIENEAGDGS